MTLVVKSALPSSDTILAKSNGIYTIPDGVNIIKIVYTDYSWRLEYNSWAIECWDSSRKCFGDIIYSGVDEIVYCRVTPGATYDLYPWVYDGENYISISMNIYYSSAINSYSGSVYTHLH